MLCKKKNTDCYRCDLVAGTKMKVNKHSQQHSLFAEKRAINSDIVFFLSVESLFEAQSGTISQDKRPGLTASHNHHVYLNAGIDKEFKYIQ